MPLNAKAKMKGFSMAVANACQDILATNHLCNAFQTAPPICTITSRRISVTVILDMREDQMADVMDNLVPMARDSIPKPIDANQFVMST